MIGNSAVWVLVIIMVAVDGVLQLYDAMDAHDEAFMPTAVRIVQRRERPGGIGPASELEAALSRDAGSLRDDRAMTVRCHGAAERMRCHRAAAGRRDGHHGISA